MDNLTEITTTELYKEIIQKHVIIVFTTEWCGDCHYLKTFIDEIVTENKDWQFVYIDRDKLLDLCIDLDILGIPSFIAYDSGKEVGRFVSKLRKTKEEVQNFINSL